MMRSSVSPERQSCTYDRHPLQHYRNTHATTARHFNVREQLGTAVELASHILFIPHSFFFFGTKRVFRIFLVTLHSGSWSEGEHLYFFRAEVSCS